MENNKRLNGVVTSLIKVGKKNNKACLVKLLNKNDWTGIKDPGSFVFLVSVWKNKLNRDPVEGDRIFFYNDKEYLSFHGYSNNKANFRIINFEIEPI